MEWGKVLGDAKMTTALVDRVAHRREIIETGYDCYRLKKRNRTRTNPTQKGEIRPLKPFSALLSFT